MSPLDATRPCDAGHARRRLKQARVFAEVVELDPEPTDAAMRSAVVSNAVLAGIAAADAICCTRLGRHAVGSDHQAAVRLLHQVADMGTGSAKHLANLLSIKFKAQYDQSDPSVAETKRAVRSMRAMLEVAGRA